jgi:hypothetical protein
MDKVQAPEIDEQLLERLQKMFSDDVQDAKNRFLRYFRYRYHDVDIEYELVTLVNNIQNKYFLAKMIVTFSKKDVDPDDFIKYFIPLEYMLSCTKTSYWPSLVTQQDDTITYGIYFKINIKWYLQAYIGFKPSNIVI